MTARISAAPVPITFSNGVTYRFSPLSDRDLDELDEWLQSRVIEIARNSLKPSATQRERDETITLAMREAQGVTYMSPLGIRTVATLSGMAHLLWMSLRKLQPDLLEDDLRALLHDPENLGLVNAKFRHVNNMKSPPKKVKRVRNRKQKR